MAAIPPKEFFSIWPSSVSPDITSSYSTGTVSGSSHVGGLVGSNDYGGSISNCYSTGSVSGSSSVGGLVGFNGDSCSISSSYFLNTSGPNNGCGTPLTNAQMKQQSSFVGWDFINEMANGTCDYWQMPQGGGYPVLSIFNGHVPPEPIGSGTAEDPYIITNANGLGTIWYRPTAHYVLVNDINLVGIQWNMAVISEFSGVLDGHGFCIKNFSINGGGYLGLFGSIEGGSVKNLGLENCSVSGSSCSQYVGGLVGDNYGSISNCYSTGAVSGSSYVGGLVGRNEGGSISNCYSTGTVSGSSCVGGLVGGKYDGSISGCYATDTVAGGDDSYTLGGLVGDNYGGSVGNCYSTGAVTAGANSQVLGGLVGDNYVSSISNCYSTGAVNGGSGSEHVGGLVGFNGDSGSISNCYSTGTVSGSSSVGGLVGENYYYSSISNCYSAGMVSGDSYVGGLVGYKPGGSINSSYFLITSGPNNGYGTPLTDAQMKQQGSFVGWDFTNETANGTNDYWRMCVNGVNYPHLNWEYAQHGDFTCPDGVNFVDFAYFAAWWPTTGCDSSNNYCGGADMNISGVVDFKDFAMFAGNWLEESNP